jgi:hypothetical protein
MITASDVPIATLMLSPIWSRMKNIIAGTITIPPPTPNNPLVIPLTNPITPAIKNCMARFCRRTRDAANTFAADPADAGASATQLANDSAPVMLPSRCALELAAKAGLPSAHIA